MRRVTVYVPLAAVVLLACAVLLFRPPDPAGPGPAEVEPLGLRCEASFAYPGREVVASWPGAWEGRCYRYRVLETGALIEVHVASFWSAPQAARSARHLVLLTAALPAAEAATTWVWHDPSQPRNTRVLAVQGRLIRDYFLTPAGEALLTPADVTALNALAGLSVSGLQVAAAIEVRPPAPASVGDRPEEAGPGDPGAGETAWLSIEPEGRPPRRYAPEGGEGPLLTLYPGEEVRVRLEEQALRDRRLALWLGRDLGRTPQGLVEFGTRAEGLFILPPDLRPGERELILADRVFAVNAGVMGVAFEAAATSYPEVDATPDGLASLLAGARRVVLAARDLPGVYRELDAALVQSLVRAAAALGGPVPDTWPPAFPDYALYVYGDEPSRARPAVICLTDPGHAAVIPGDVRLAGAEGLWELARAALEPPPPAADDPRRLLRATRVELRFAGEDRPVVLDLAGGPEAAGRVGGLARAICEGIVNNLYEPEGEPLAFLTFTVAGRREEVKVYSEEARYAGDTYWREGLLDLVRGLAGR